MIQILVETTMNSFHFKHPKCGYVLQTPSQTCTKSNEEIDWSVVMWAIMCRLSRVVFQWELGHY